jgi:hypothetical protein
MQNARVFATGMSRAVVELVRRHIPFGMVAALVVALVMACDNGHDEDDTQFRKDVIWCEEAVAHLEECCGNLFDAHQVECRHFYSKDEGCGSQQITRIDPAYTLEESECVREQSCDWITSNKICERALVAGKARKSVYDSREVDTPTVGTSSSTSGVVTTSSSSSGSSAFGKICP